MTAAAAPSSPARVPGSSFRATASNAAAATACSSAYNAVGGAPIVKVRSTWPAYSGAAAALISHVATPQCRHLLPGLHQAQPGIGRIKVEHVADLLGQELVLIKRQCPDQPDPARQ